MFSPMEGKERTSVYLVGWANAWDWMPFWKDWCPTYQEGWCGFYNIPYAPLRSAQNQRSLNVVRPTISTGVNLGSPCPIYFFMLFALILLSVYFSRH